VEGRLVSSIGGAKILPRRLSQRPSRCSNFHGKSVARQVGQILSKVVR